jgi:Sugar kinases, ribokinase family
MANIVCFGEVLWDVFKTNKTIGGAPLNVALRLQALQNNVTIISSVGKDVDGKELLTSITKQGVNTLNIQTDNTHATSNVLVSLDDFGTATYEIKYPCAWDFIAINLSILNAVKETDAFVFGSLVARHIISYNTLLELVNIAAFNVFDVNLRPPHYTFTVIETLMQKAHFIKFNDDELYEISNYLNFKSTDLEEVVKFISKHTNTTTICVTLGKDGALLFLTIRFTEIMVIKWL